MHVEGFSKYLALYPLAEVRRGRQRETEARQLWDTLKLGTPLCYLFNLLPGQPEISGVGINPEGVDLEDVGAHRSASKSFVDALQSVVDAGQWPGATFEFADLYPDSGDMESGKVTKVGVQSLKMINSANWDP